MIPAESCRDDQRLRPVSAAQSEQEALQRGGGTLRERRLCTQRLGACARELRFFCFDQQEVSIWRLNTAWRERSAVSWRAHHFINAMVNFFPPHAVSASGIRLTWMVSSMVQAGENPHGYLAGGQGAPRRDVVNFRRLQPGFRSADPRPRRPSHLAVGSVRSRETRHWLRFQWEPAQAALLGSSTWGPTGAAAYKKLCFACRDPLACFAG